ncbi:MAG: peptide chain release factor N(5)-glutamine methyltransferase [Myxococcales bacterium]|nr:peptide chain release factor N(5)-glutamine methyltransferase [Myxococcales bacterium]
MERWTVLSLLNWCRDFFAGKGIATARLDAELLLAHVLGTDRLGLYLRYDQPLEAAELQTLHELVARRGRREPLAHLLGTKEFYSLSFLSDGRVLTPRPETELLVDKTLEALAADAPQRLCEIGVGSGCVTIALATQRPLWRFTATDISAAALGVAAENLRRHGVADRVTLYEADLFAADPEPYDAVLSNPPYLTTAECGAAMPEVAQYEPATALDGGDDGLAVIRRLIAAAPERLRPGGLLALECGAGQSPAVLALLRESGAFTTMAAWRDLAGTERVLTARRREN